MFEVFLAYVSGLIFVAWVFCSVVALAHSGYLPSVVAVGFPIENASGGHS